MNEFDLIKKYIKPLSNEDVILGKGDDCSILPYNDEYDLICTSDALVEHKHFRLQDMNLKELGYKSLAVNLSDISAMGGKAKWAQLSLAIPESIKESDIADFFSGFYELAEQEAISLTGGDIAASAKDLFINITLMGLVKKNEIKRRDHFSQGEVLVVTGFLGDSSAGLKCLLENKKGDLENQLIQKHIRPQSFHAQGQWLAQSPSVKGMMDLSDGLLSDLNRIPTAGFSIDLNQIPISQQLIGCSVKYGWDPTELALSGGEDYVLLFSCTENGLIDLQKEYEKVWKQKLYPIGRVNKSGKTEFSLNGKTIDLSYKTFSHF